MSSSGDDLAAALGVMGFLGIFLIVDGFSGYGAQRSGESGPILFLTMAALCHKRIQLTLGRSSGIVRTDTVTQ